MSKGSGYSAKYVLEVYVMCQLYGRLGLLDHMAAFGIFSDYKDGFDCPEKVKAFLEEKVRHDERDHLIKVMEQIDMLRA